jgi:hypothetical protein
VLGGERGDRAGRPGQRLHQAQQSDAEQGGGGRRDARQGAQDVRVRSLRSRGRGGGGREGEGQGEGQEGGRLEGGEGGRQGAAEGQGRAEQQDGEQAGRQAVRVAYHLAQPTIDGGRRGRPQGESVTARSRAFAALFVSTMAALSSDRAVAQFDQYRAPGGPLERPRARKESLEQAIEDARWRVGRVRVDPWLGVSNIEYVDNAFGVPEGAGEPTADVTATAGAGLRAFLPSGPKLVWAAHALPEYTWWRELEDRRGVNGRYGLGAFGFFNRLTLEATAARDQGQRVITPEVPQEVRQRTDRAGLALELEATRRISVFVAGDRLELRHRLAGDRDPRTVPADQLDRDQTLLRGGLRYRFPGGWAVGAGVERSDVEFTAAVPPAEDRSNRGTSPFLELRREGPNDYLRIEVAQRSLEPVDGSSFEPYDATTAAFEVGLNTAGRLVTWLYGSRNLIYSLAEGYSDFQDDRVGLALERELGWRTRLRVFGEGGRNDYRAAVPGVADREDDTRAYGLAFNFKIGKASSFSLQVTRTELDSNLPGLDRTVTSLGTGLNFGGHRTSWY